MNISLTPELEALINDMVASGLYNSASEVVHEGLRLLKERDELQRIQIEELRRDITLGMEQIRRGEGKKYDSGSSLAAETKRRGRQRLEAEQKVAK